MRFIRNDRENLESYTRALPVSLGRSFSGGVSVKKSGV